MNATLKRCPFCGVTAKILSFFHFDSPKKARKAWNNRYSVN